MEGLSLTTEKNLIQSGIGEKNYKLKEKEILVENIGNDGDWALSFVFEKIDFLKKEPDFSIQRLKHNLTICILCLGQISYSSGPLPKVTNTQAKSTGSQKKSAKFFGSHLAKS